MRIRRLLEKNYSLSYPDLKDEIRKLFIAGYTITQLTEKIIAKYPLVAEYHPKTFVQIIDDAKASFNRELDPLLIETIYYKHLLLYDKIYRYFSSINSHNGVRKTLLLRNQFLRLRGFDGIDIEQNNILINEKNKFDFSKLNEEERRKLDEYIWKINNSQ